MDHLREAQRFRQLSGQLHRLACEAWVKAEAHQAASSACAATSSPSVTGASKRSLVATTVSS